MNKQGMKLLIGALCIGLLSNTAFSQQEEIIGGIGGTGSQEEIIGGIGGTGIRDMERPELLERPELRESREALEDAIDAADDAGEAFDPDMPSLEDLPNNDTP